MTSGYASRASFDKPMQVRFSHELIEKIDTWGSTAKMTSRSEAIRTLIEAGLEAQKENGLGAGTPKPSETSTTA